MHKIWGQIENIIFFTWILHQITYDLRALGGIWRIECVLTGLTFECDNSVVILGEIWTGGVTDDFYVSPNTGETLKHICYSYKFMEAMNRVMMYQTVQFLNHASVRN